MPKLVWVLVIAGLVGGPAGYFQASARAPDPASADLTANQLGFMEHIDHIVFVVMENHAFDSYFGTYCPVAGPNCPAAAGGIPAGTCVPENDSQPAGPCVRPWNFTAKNLTLTSPLPHGYQPAHESWNFGAMDGFYQAENSGRDPFGHYNGTTLPVLWDLAEEYALSDNFYSSVLSYSLPNHWHIVAGQAPQVIVQNHTQGFPGVTANQTLAIDRKYLSEANRTKSVEDLLLGSNVSWRYYDYTLGTYAKAIQIQSAANGTKIGSVGSAYDYWNPQAAKAESYNASFVRHFAPNFQFFADARKGNLANLSWVIPGGHESEHPGANETLGESWLASVVDAVEASPEWNTTALYVTWDDFGGFWDNVAPPTEGGQQLGIRVPLLEISPYTAAGAIPHHVAYFESVLHLMEWRFHLGCIATLDCGAPLPLYAYNWSMSPRPPIIFPTNLSQATYPFDPGWNASVERNPSAFTVPSEFLDTPLSEAPDVD